MAPPRFSRNQNAPLEVVSPVGSALLGNPPIPPCPGYEIAPSLVIRATRPGFAGSVAHSAPSGPWTISSAAEARPGTGVTRVCVCACALAASNPKIGSRRRRQRKCVLIGQSPSTRFSGARTTTFAPHPPDFWAATKLANPHHAKEPLWTYVQGSDVD